MVWVQEQLKVAQGNDGAPTLTLDAAATADQLIVVSVTARSGTLTPPSGYSEATGAGGSGNALIGLYYKVAAGGETVITPGLTGTAHWVLGVMEYSGNGLGDPLDQEDYNGSGNDTENTFTAGPTGTLAEATELGIVISATQGVDNDVHAWDNGYSLVFQQTSGGGAAANRVGLSVGEQFDVGTAAEESLGTWSSARRCACSIVTFKAAAAGAGSLVIPRKPLRAMIGR